MTYRDLIKLNLYNGDEKDLEKSIKIIYENKSEFENFRITNQKLNFVKRIRDFIPDMGLKYLKQVADLYWLDSLPKYIVEQRKVKLENISMKNMIPEIVIKMKEISDDELTLKLMKLSFDELTSFYETFSDKLNN